MTGVLAGPGLIVGFLVGLVGSAAPRAASTDGDW